MYKQYYAAYDLAPTHKFIIGSVSLQSGSYLWTSKPKKLHLWWVLVDSFQVGIGLDRRTDAFRQHCTDETSTSPALLIKPEAAHYALTINDYCDQCVREMDLLDPRA